MLTRIDGHVECMHAVQPRDDGLQCQPIVANLAVVLRTFLRREPACRDGARVLEPIDLIAQLRRRYVVIFASSQQRECPDGSPQRCRPFETARLPGRTRTVSGCQSRATPNYTPRSVRVPEHRVRGEGQGQRPYCDRTQQPRWQAHPTRRRFNARQRRRQRSRSAQPARQPSRARSGARWC